MSAGLWMKFLRRVPVPVSALSMEGIVILRLLWVSPWQSLGHSNKQDRPSFHSRRGDRPKSKLMHDMTMSWNKCLEGLEKRPANGPALGRWSGKGVQRL